MSDIQTTMIQPEEAGQVPSFGWSLSNPGLGKDDGLQTAIIISLFTYRLAEPDDIIPDGTTNRRGWWGDAYADVEGDLIGSRLWLLSREKDTLKVVQRAREYAQESLQWMIEDQVAEKVVVETGWIDKISGSLTPTKNRLSMPGVLGINVAIYRPNSPVAKYNFQTFWESL